MLTVIMYQYMFTECVTMYSRALHREVIYSCATHKCIAERLNYSKVR